MLELGGRLPLPVGSTVAPLPHEAVEWVMLEGVVEHFKGSFESESLHALNVGAGRALSVQCGVGLF